MTKLSTANPWILRFAPNPDARLRLICFPYAGGGGSIFRRWLEELPPTIDVLAIQPPGRESRLSETPITHLRDIAYMSYLALLPYLDLPLVLFGHSMGALLSFEVARYLCASRVPDPLALIVSGRSAPHIPEDDLLVDQLSDRQLVEELRRLNGTPEVVLQDNELLQLLLPSLRADFKICESYRHIHGTPLTCPIIAMGGVQDFKVNQESLGSWQTHTRGRFVVRMLPGDHFFLQQNRKQFLQVLIEELARCTVDPLWEVPNQRKVT